ncbi:MAG: AbgT family transporter, partial [Bacilli bacterium]
MKKRKKAKVLFGPIVTILILTFLIMIASFVLSIVGMESDKTVINNGQLETDLVTVNNIFSSEGLEYLASGIITNFMMFEPLVLLILALIAVGIGEASGLFKASFNVFKKINPNLLTFFVFLLGVIASVIGEYSYIILLPLIGVLYKTLGRNAILGILTVFLGITLGYGTGFIFSYDDYLLGVLTTDAARLSVDKEYIFGLFSNIYIMIASTIIISIAGSGAIIKFLAPKFKKPDIISDDLVISKKALLISRIALGFMILFVLYMIIPGIKGSGLFLGDGQRYIERLFGNDAPFHYGIIYVFLIIMMVCGFIYGYVSKNIKDTNGYSLGLSKNFENLGYVFVLMFFAAQMMAILNWTNLSEVIGAQIIEWLSMVELSGMLLIVVLFVAIIVIGF